MYYFVFANEEPESSNSFEILEWEAKDWPLNRDELYISLLICIRNAYLEYDVPIMFYNLNLLIKLVKKLRKEGRLNDIDVVFLSPNGELVKV